MRIYRSPDGEEEGAEAFYVITPDRHVDDLGGVQRPLPRNVTSIASPTGKVRRLYRDTAADLRSIGDFLEDAAEKIAALTVRVRGTPPEWQDPMVRLLLKLHRQVASAAQQLKDRGDR